VNLCTMPFALFVLKHNDEHFSFVGTFPDAEQAGTHVKFDMNPGALTSYKIVNLTKLGEAANDLPSTPT